MNTRRKFLMQGSLASTALLIAKPFESLANATAPITGFTLNNNKVVLAHTCSANNAVNELSVKQLTQLKRNTGNVLLLNAGTAKDSNISNLAYDASLHLNNSVSESMGNYKIIYKADVKIGIITANVESGNVITESNALATYLKEEKNCKLVICLSQLGYKNKNTIDDRTLANASTDIDIIIGGNHSNFSKMPVVAHNSKQEEVIIHSATDNGFALGNIEIGFDKDQNKSSIDFNNFLDRVN